MIRELLVAPRRYSDLKAALPGAASNLIAARVRELQRLGVVTSSHGTPSPARRYELTALGRELEEPLLALTRWGGHGMQRGTGTDQFRPDWLVVALRALLADRAAMRTNRPRAVLHVDGGAVTVTVGPCMIDVQLGATPHADVVMRSDPETALAVAAGAVRLTQAVLTGRARIHGSVRATHALARLFRGRTRTTAAISDAP